MSDNGCGMSMLSACTIIARNYLPFAHVLADSFLAHHPGGAFTILLVDGEPATISAPDGRIQWRGLRDIGLDTREIVRLTGIYDVTELSTAVKPLLVRHLLDAGHSQVVYFDPDIRIYAPLADVAALAAQHDIVLTPHTMLPYPPDQCEIDGQHLLGSGIYNLGFIAVSDRARPFLDWWWDKTRRDALNSPAEMMFTDQRWIDFVPALFDHHILKDPGCNVAYWNLHGRELTVEGDRYLADGVPLRFFHFSGFDPERPWLLSKHQGQRPRILLSEHPVLARLCDDYLRSLEGAGLNATDRVPYRYAALPSGLRLTSRIRRLYRSALMDWEERGGSEPPAPFDPEDPEAFLDWLNAPDPRGSRFVSRFLWSIYRDRPDVQSRFPAIHGDDVQGFFDWILKFGVEDETIPLELLPDKDRGPSPSNEPVPPGAIQEGVHVVGYLRAELGVGEAARQLIAGLDAAGIRHKTTTYDATLSRQSHSFVDRAGDGAEYDVNILNINADSTPEFSRLAGPAFFAGRHTVGYWFWEVEQFPETMHRAFDVVDEVWTATDFVARAIRDAGVKPVYTVPLPVAVPVIDPQIDRRRLGLTDAFTFLFVFDFMSVFERKNPLGLIEAFAKAFEPGEGPVLLIKSINGELRLEELERLRAAAARRPDIVIKAGYYTAAEMSALLAACDCYVSLHRSEGLGLTMAEAMALGKPVIATGYSGNLHFMTPETSYLIDYTRVKVPATCPPYPPTTDWAQPDSDHAAAAMREVYDRPDAARARGQHARRHILEHHDAANAGRRIADRLEAIRQRRRSRVAPAFASTPVVAAARAPSTAIAAEQLEALIGPLTELSTLKTGGGGGAFGGIRLAAQRLLFRVLRPLWFQQQQFHTQVIAALRVTAGALRAEEHARDVAEARLRELTRRVLSARREVARLARAVDRNDDWGRHAQAIEAELTRLEERALSLDRETASERGRDKS